MKSFLLDQYLWIKAAHIIFVIAWMAGLLMAPRLRIYQLSSQPGEALFEQMRSAAARLRKIILTPGMIIVWGLGLTMIWLNPALLSAGWFHVKLALVIFLTAAHGYFVLVGQRVDAAAGGLSEKRLRLLNEVPFLLMIPVVLLAVTKPF